MALLSHCRHWVFDMDGTLTLAAHDFDLLRQQLDIEAGLPILEAIAGMPADEARSAHRKLHQLEMDIAADSRPQPGALDALTTLNERGCSLGIVTRNARDIAFETLTAAGLRDFFSDSDIIGREDCTPKPDPAGIERLMTRWQAGRSDTVMTGDYVFDLEAGRNAGVTTIHFDPKQLYPWPDMTDVKISHLEQLHALL